MIATTRRAQVPGGELAYLDEGTGPAVVLLHGFPATSFLWREFVPLLADRFRVLVPDLLGSGDSVSAPGAPLDARSQATAVAALLHGLGLDRFAPVGQGTGGAVAQILALDVPGADAMVLLDAVTEGVPLAGKAARLGGVVADASPASAEAGIRGLLAEAVGGNGALPPPIADAYVRPWVEGPGPDRLVATVGALAEDGLAGRGEELRAIGFPVLILWGEDDMLVPVAVADRLNEAMPSSTLGLLPGCGHLLPEEAPATIGPMIAEYLRARYLMEPHGHEHKEGLVMLQMERRLPWMGPPDERHGSEGEG